MTGDLVVTRHLVIPAREMEETASRSGGPGGQNVNKVSSRVSLRWNVAGSLALREAQRVRLLARLASRITAEGWLLVHADGSRSQLDNRLAARRRLAMLVRDALHEPKARRATKPTRGSERRRLEGKQRRSSIKRERRPPPDD